MKFIHIPADPALPRTVLECDGHDSAYATIRDGVGGYIEPIDLPESFSAEPHTMFVHDEGKLLRLRLNFVATALTRGVLAADDLVVGDVVITGGVDRHGNTLGVSDDVLRVWG